MKMQEHVSLKNHTTFRAGGEARYFFDVKTQEGLREAIHFSKNKSLPFFILGGGSNTLFVTPLFHGVVVRINIPGRKFEDYGETTRVRVGAGENWDSFVEEVVSRNLFGVENLSAIPGSVGAAPIQNIGAYGSEVKDVIESVEVFDTEASASENFSNDECRFGYRDSLFKTKEGKRFVVTGVVFRLKKNGSLNLSYKDVREYFDNNKDGKEIRPTLESVRQAVIEIRRRKLPDTKEIGTAGSFFKNPVLGNELYKDLRGRFGEIPGSPVGDSMTKVSAGWLLEHVGNFKGIRRGDAGVWGKQSLVLVNWGSATGEDIYSLAKEMRDKIKDETGIELQTEVVIV